MKNVLLLLLLALLLALTVPASALEIAPFDVGETYQVIIRGVDEPMSETTGALVELGIDPATTVFITDPLSTLFGYMVLPEDAVREDYAYKAVMMTVASHSGAASVQAVVPASLEIIGDIAFGNPISMDETELLLAVVSDGSATSAPISLMLTFTENTDRIGVFDDEVLSYEVCYNDAGEIIWIIGAHG